MQMRRVPALGWITIFLLAGLFGLSTTARADGKVFAAQVVAEPVEMPDQRALLAWREGVETLVIESAFVGRGTEFAWVVPLPSKPEVFPATRGTVASAVALMQPVVAKPSRWAGVVASYLGVVAAVALTLGWRWAGRALLVFVYGSFCLVLTLLIHDRTGSAVYVVITVILCAVTAWMLRPVFARSFTLRSSLLLLGGVSVIPALLLPTNGLRSLGVASESASAVSVERHLVGDHDVAVLSARERGGVVAWLTENGFALDSASREVAETHAAAGGWFVASRVRRDRAERSRELPAPLAFRFATRKPVYPMALTGAGATRSLTVELVVFGPSEAKVAGLRRVAAAPLEWVEPAAMGGWFGRRQPNDRRRVSHPELARWAAGTAAATRLRGELAPAEMSRDLEILWTGDVQPRGLAVYSKEDARTRAALAGAAVLFLGAVASGLRFGAARPSLRMSGWVAAVVTLTLVGVCWALPTAPVRNERDALGSVYAMRDLSSVFLVNHEMNKTAVSAEVARELMRQAAREVGLNPQEIDARADGPGGVWLEALPGGRWRLHPLDAHGQPRFDNRL